MPSLQALKQRAQQLLENQRSLQQQNQALAAERLGFQSERDLLSTQYQELSAERDALQAEHDSLTAHFQEVTAQRDSIQEQLETLQTTVEELQGQLTAQSAQTAERSQQREALQARVEELQGQLSAQTAEVSLQPANSHAGSSHHWTSSAEGLPISFKASRDNALAPFPDKIEPYPIAEIQATSEYACPDEARAELDRVKDLNHRARAALNYIFPYSAYQEISRDIRGLARDELVDHFLDCEIEGGALLSEANVKDISSVSTSDPFASFLVSACRHFPGFFDALSNHRDAQRPNANNRQLSTAKTLSKTAGLGVDLAMNEAHEFSARFSMLHYRSGAVCTYIPKNACTSLRYSMALANGFIGGADELEWIHANNTAMAPTSSKDILNASATFVFLRSPFSRLVSYFMDKVVGSSASDGDRSYSHAKNLLGPVDEDRYAFLDFVKAVSGDPTLIASDIHLRRQVDFLLYRDYDYWLSVEEFDDGANLLRDKIGLEIVDTRSMTAHTSYGLRSLSDIFYGDTPVGQLRKLKASGMAPSASSMLNPEICYRIFRLYFSDVLLYCKYAKSADAIKPWIDAAFRFAVSKT